jgi:hypothetical protein
MHACHLTLKHCTHILIFFIGKIINKVQQDCGQRKNHWVDDNKEIIVLTLEWEKDEMNLIIRKISKKWEDQSCHEEESLGHPCKTPRSANQEAPNFQNLAIGNYRVNPTLKKHQVFQPCHQENLVNFSYHEGKMSTLQSGRTNVNPTK